MILAGKRLTAPTSDSPSKTKKLKEEAEVPSKCKSKLWIEHSDKLKNDFVEPLHGRWLLFYKTTVLDSKWELAKQLYDQNKLENIISMKVSTAMPNPKSTNPEEGVIEMHVGRLLIVDDETSDEKLILEQGKDLLKLFNYHSKQGKMYYKDVTNDSTQPPAIKKRNYRIVIDCPRLDENRRSNNC
eukprot:TRINITY_DN15973_c0_g5_i1.p1 TRINITY_DN15973_c0_g5~~TRINITY_DN15973_c0_g5_i1.p1  ORF type:complete len:185 (-),score=55.87 TRINITY_DN15973_c0_g5_i1:137-691(-)